MDTSVWLDFFQQRSTPAISRFEEILEQNLLFDISGLIYQEVLQGADSDEDFAKLQTYLQTQKFYHPQDPVGSYQEAANLYFRCRRNGITIRSTVDCFVAQIAIEHHLRLLHNDRDFTQLATVVPDLKLA